jgi:hypothetical protein
MELLRSLELVGYPNPHASRAGGDACTPGRTANKLRQAEVLMDLVTATDIESWADRRDAQAQIPQLVREGVSLPG